jgi:hypothetical protein
LPGPKKFKRPKSQKRLNEGQSFKEKQFFAQILPKIKHLKKGKNFQMARP